MSVNNNTTVLVLSRNGLIGLNVVRALGVAGYTVDLISNVNSLGTTKYLVSSKYVRWYREIASKKSRDGNDTVLLEAIVEYAKQSKEKVVLFPVDYYTTAIVDLNREKLENLFYICTYANNKKAGAIVDLMDESMQMRMAAEAGIDTYREWEIELGENFILPDDIKYPCIVSSANMFLGYKKDNNICYNQDELRRHLNKMKFYSANRKARIKEQLALDTKIVVAGLCNGENIFVPSVVLERKDVVANNSNLYLLETVSKDCLNDVYDKVLNMLKHYNYTGLFELHLDVVGGTAYFRNLILGPEKSVCVFLKSNINLPHMLISGLLVDKEENAIPYGERIVYEHNIWNGYISGDITKTELNEHVNSADITCVRNEEDPTPEKHFVTLNEQKRLNRIRKAKKAKIKKQIKKYIFPILRKIKMRLLRYPQIHEKNKRKIFPAKPRVLVTGRNYASNLCIARAIGIAGYEVEVLRIFHRKPKRRNVLKWIKPDAYSKYIKAYHTCVYGGRSIRVFNKLVSIADPNSKMLIIPADDLMASIVDDYYSELKQYYVCPNIDDKAGQINHIMAKAVQKELAKKAGLPVVNSCVIKTVNGCFTIPETVGYPCFIKPNISKNGSKTKMRRCGSEQELFDALTELAEIKDVEMLVEDYVDINREYSILGVSTKEGSIGPGYFGAEEGGQEEHRGVAITGRVYSVQKEEKLIRDIEKFVSGLKFDGLYDVDLIETTDGKIYFVELNMRFGGSGYAITKSGVNLPGMFADYMLLGKPIDTTCCVKDTGKDFVSEKILIEEYMKGRLSWQKYKDIMNKVEIHFIKDDEDRKPFNHFRRYYIVAKLMRIRNKVKGIASLNFDKDN